MFLSRKSYKIKSFSPYFKCCRGKQKALVSYIFNSYLILDFLSFSLFYRLCAHFQSIAYFSVSRLILAYLGIFIPPNGLNIALKWTIFSSSFRISDNVRRVHLHQVRLHKKASLTETGATDNKNIFVSCILRLFRSAGHHQLFRLCQKDIIFKHSVHIWLYVLGIAPPCGTVFYTLPELLGILGFIIHHKSERYAACHTNQ